jgi:hypothetical protein
MSVQKAVTGGQGNEWNNGQNQGSRQRGSRGFDGRPETQERGKLDQAVGNIKQTVEQVVDKAKDAVKSGNRKRPLA